MVGIPPMTANHGGGEPSPDRLPRGIESKDRGVGEALDIGLQTTDPVAELFREHGNDPVSQVDTVPPLLRFLVEGRTRLHVVGDVRNMDGQFPVAALFPGHGYRVVEVPGIFRVDREDLLFPPILPPGQFLVGNHLLDRIRFGENGGGKLER